MRKNFLPSFEFRAWLKDKMYYGKEAVEVYFTEYINDPLCFQDNGIVVMLHTGLSDKNGNKIFQYDIIDQGDNFNSVVMYGDTGETIGFCLREVHKKTHEYWPREHGLLSYSTIPSETAVIGNVFQNPEMAGVWWNRISNVGKKAI